MGLIKVSILNSIATLVKVLCAVAINKILAVYVGPGGYAIIGQFQNFISLLVNISGGLLSVGVTSITAKNAHDNEVQHAVWQTALKISFYTSLMMAAVVFFLADSFAKSLLESAHFLNPFIWLGMALPIMVANNIFLSIIGGKKEISILVKSNILSSILNLLFIGSLTHFFKLNGALLAIIITPVFVLMFTVLLVVNKNWFKPRLFWGRINYGVLRDFSSFGFMTLFAALIMPLTTILVRDAITANLGLSAAGLWQGVWRISEIYLMIVTSTLSAYYLPRLAEIRSVVELKEEIIKIYYFLMPITVSGAIVIYLLRDILIEKMFTADFFQMRYLFFWQLIGDVLKISSWILSCVLITRVMTKSYIIAEIFFSTIFIALNYACINFFQVSGPTIAYAISYFFYLVLVFLMVKYQIFKNR